MIEFVNFLAFRKYIITTSFFHTFHPRSRFLVNTDHICQQLKTKTILKGFKTHQSLINKQKHIKYTNQRTSKNTVTLTSDFLQIKKNNSEWKFYQICLPFSFLDINVYNLLVQSPLTTFYICNDWSIVDSELVAISVFALVYL